MPSATPLADSTHQSGEAKQRGWLRHLRLLNLFSFSQPIDSFKTTLFTLSEYRTILLTLRFHMWQLYKRTREVQGMATTPCLESYFLAPCRLAGLFLSAPHAAGQQHATIHVRFMYISR